MKNIVLISRCLKIQHRQNSNLYSFHFKGFYAGQKIRAVILHRSSNVDPKIKVGYEYLLYVEVISLRQGTLKGKIVKFKQIEDLSLNFY